MVQRGADPNGTKPQRLAHCGVFSKYPKGNGGALWSIEKLSKARVFCCFWSFSKSPQKIGEALRVIMKLKIGQNVFSSFLPCRFCCLQQISKNRRGAMWRYPKIWKNSVFLNFCRFCCFQQISKNRRGAMWRYVALCGAIPKIEKTLFFSILAVFVVFSKSPKTGVALCGAMWPYPKIWKNCVFLNVLQLFVLFSVNFQKQAWRYVAPCGTMWCYPKIWKNNCSFHFCCLFFLLLENLKKTSLALYGGIAESEKNRCFNVIALCGVAPRLQFSANVYNSRGLYGVSKECQRQKCSQCCFRCLKNMSKKILVELCGGCPALQNEHIFNFGIHGVMRFEVVAKRVEIAYSFISMGWWEDGDNPWSLRLEVAKFEWTLNEPMIPKIDWLIDWGTFRCCTVALIRVVSAMGHRWLTEFLPA